MFDDSILLSFSCAWDMQGLEQWTKAWYEQAVQAEFIQPPYHADADGLERLRGYFNVGLSPAEAAQAYFGRKH
ncbi:hypothetical protein [Pararobbsia alpina]|uniref:Uncharacterized protein n=1 Tax=Pararobbsia alpina TaxID=621374 RepID=A0A6S7BI42_9BURK|nr:hypothetical protein [Pararobbsia alpina]CAB3789410.1 hypothetical protein LMG28138_02763 [Pararobbsia alpina]